MVDTLTKKQRQKCMSSNKGSDTKPEILLRKALWKSGLRYRLNSHLPGRPDIVFKSARVAVFVDGCFWHGCKVHKNIPKTNRQFWKSKINKNKARDKEVTAILKNDNWKVIRVWEHDVNESLEKVTNQIKAIIKEKIKK